MKPQLPEPTLVSYQTDSTMRTMEVRSYSAYEVQRLIDEAYAAGQKSQLPEVDELAQQIRFINGGHKLGAGALAGKLLDWLQASDSSTRPGDVMKE